MRRSFPVWLAIIALMLQALWPLLAHAKPNSAKLLVPVCTIEGITHYLELPGSNAPLEQRSASQHEHCALCVFGAERLAAIPAAPVPALRIEVVSYSVAVPSAALPAACLCSPPALPRAPPALS